MIIIERTITMKRMIMKKLIVISIIVFNLNALVVVAQPVDTVVESDYYTVNIKKCQLVDVDEMIKDPKPFVGKFVCGYARMLSDEYLITGLNTPFDFTSNTTSIVYSGLEEDEIILFEKLSKYEKEINVFIYGRVFVPNSSHLIKNKKFPKRDGTMFLRYPKIVILKPVN